MSPEGVWREPDCQGTQQGVWKVVYVWEDIYVMTPEGVWKDRCVLHDSVQWTLNALYTKLGIFKEGSLTQVYKHRFLEVRSKNEQK